MQSDTTRTRSVSGRVCLGLTTATSRAERRGRVRFLVPVVLAGSFLPTFLSSPSTIPLLYLHSQLPVHRHIGLTLLPLPLPLSLPLWSIHSAAVYALTQWLNCSPIYVVNRDKTEVDQFIAAFEASSTDKFKPELVHVETVEEAEKLAAPGAYLSFRSPLLRRCLRKIRERTREWSCR